MKKPSINHPGVIVTIAIVLVCGAAAGLARWYYLGERAALDSSVLREMQTIAAAKSQQIANWRRERLGDGHVLASAPVRMLARKILAGNSTSEADRSTLLDVLQRAVSVFHYSGAALVDREGRALLVTSRTATDPERYRELLAAAGAGGQQVLSDLYLERLSNRPWMSLTVPMDGGGALILDIDPEAFLFPYLRMWPTPRRSAETLLVRIESGDVVYLSDMREAPGAPLRRRRSLSGVSLPSFKAFAEGWTYTGRKDYRGAWIMGVIREIPDSNWYLITKIDTAEAQQPLRNLGWQLALIAGLIVVANGAAAGLVWKSRQLRVFRDREAWFRHIANDTPAHLWMTTPYSEVSFINHQFARFLGAGGDRPEIAWLEILHPADKERVVSTFERCVSERSDYSDEFRLRRFDGEYRWVVANALPRSTPEGQFAGYAGSVVDITERRRAEQEVRDANTALAAELEERTRSGEQIRALTSRLISAQEEERTRLARELHDDLSQEIAAVSIATSHLKKKIPAIATEAIEHSRRIQDKLVHLSECVRRLSRQLHPSVLQHAGLAAAVSNYCSEIAALTSHRIVFRGEGSFEGVPSASALCVYRVAQEAIQNSIRHSGVKESEVELICRDGALQLTVSDRGAGIDWESARVTRGLGLVSMQERAKLVHGKLVLEGRPGGGATVHLELPAPASANNATAGA